MATRPERPDFSIPHPFLVEVHSELTPEITQRRCDEVNVLLRMSMLSGVQLHLESTLNIICDFAQEIVPFESALVHFWDDAAQQVELAVKRNLDLDGARMARVNLLHFWATKSGRPLLVTRGVSNDADQMLDEVHANSALLIPLMVTNRMLGSLQLFSPDPEAFNREDAQLLWLLALIAEHQLTRDYANEGLIRYAFTDYLTGLRTRGYFEQQLELEFARAERKRQQIAVLMIDIDHFKQFNDTFGHQVGDQVLRTVASILMRDMREVDTVARYGGEEFVIVLPDTGPEGAIYVAERLRRGVEQSEFRTEPQHKIQHLTISVGVATFPEDAGFKRELVQVADVALYAAKHRGRNRVITFDELRREHRQKEVS